MASSGKLKFGPYEVLRNPDDTPCILGEGSFGTTYKARHEILGRITALKVIREELLNRGHKSDHEESSRFLDEARAAGRLGHPGIAMVYDCALDKGVFYYAMEFCDGGTLQDWCETNGPMPWPDVRRIALQIASALDYAHENGFLHRDIKPANIMLNGSGKGRQAKLIDFGLAKKITTDNDSSSATVRNEQDNFRGNFATASPEQVLEKTLDPRSDLFSLGVTLWWLLIGKNPFENMKRGPLIADRVSPTPYSDSLPADLAPEARRLLSTLLEKDVSKRIPSAHEVLEMLSTSSEQPGEASSAGLVSTENFAPLATPAELEDGYQLEGIMASRSQVKLYHASDIAARRPVVVVTPSGDGPDPDTLGRLRVAGSRRLDFGAYAFIDWRISGGCDAFVLSEPEGCSLLSILRKFGPARFADALPLLSHLARCFDASLAWTSFAIRVDPGEIFLKARDGGVDLGRFRAWPDVDPLAVRCLPLFSADADHAATTEVTLSTSAQEFPPLAQFAAFVYRVVSGSSVRYAAFFTTSGYVMASGLSEDGNALLSETICAPESQPSACHFLQLLASLESQPLSELRAFVEPPSASDLAIGRLELGPRLEPAGGQSLLADVISKGPLLAKEVVSIDNSVSVMDKVAELERQLAQARQAAEDEARHLAEDQARHEAEEARRKAADEEQRLAIEARKRADEMARQAAEAQRAADEMLRKHEEEKRRAEEEAKQRAEQEAKRRAEMEAKRQAEEDEKRRRVEQERLAQLEKERLEKEKQVFAAQQAKIAAETRQKAEQEARVKREAAERLANEEKKRCAAEQSRRDTDAKRTESAPKAAASQAPMVPRPSVSQPPPAVSANTGPVAAPSVLAPDRAKGSPFPLKWVAAAAAFLLIAAVSAALVLRGGRDTPEPEPDNGGIAVVPDESDAGSPVTPHVTTPVAPLVPDKPPETPQPTPMVGNYFLSIVQDAAGGGDPKAVPVKYEVRRADRADEASPDFSSDPQPVDPGSKWRIILKHDEKPDVLIASVDVHLPGVEAGLKDVNHTIRVPSHLPAIRIHNPYATADYVDVKIKGPEAGTQPPVKLSKKESEITLKPKEWTPSEAIVREVSEPFPGKDKPIVFPIAGPDVWIVTFTGSHLGDKSFNRSLKDPASMEIKADPPLGGLYSFIAPMTRFPPGDECELEKAKPVESEKGAPPEVNYFNEMVYLEYDDQAKNFRRTLKSEAPLLDLPHFLCAVMEIDFKKQAGLSNMRLLKFFPHVEFVHLSGYLTVSGSAFNEIRLRFDADASYLTDAGVHEDENKNHPNTIAWLTNHADAFKAYTDAAEYDKNAKKQIYDKNLHQAFADWVSYYRSFPQIGKQAADLSSGLDFRLWKPERRQAVYLMDIEITPQKELRLHQVMREIEKDFFYSGYKERDDSPPKVRSVFLKSSSDSPGPLLKREP